MNNNVLKGSDSLYGSSQKRVTKKATREKVVIFINIRNISS